jgi:hypothetical protein
MGFWSGFAFDFWRKIPFQFRLVMEVEEDGQGGWAGRAGLVLRKMVVVGWQ